MENDVQKIRKTVPQNDWQGYGQGNEDDVDGTDDKAGADPNTSTPSILSCHQSTLKNAKKPPHRTLILLLLGLDLPRLHSSPAGIILNQIGGKKHK